MAIVLQGKAAEKVSGQSFNKQNLEVVRVLDIILNINHPKFEDYGGYDSIGTIYYSELSINTPYEKLWASTTQIAKPLFSHLKYYPLINEIVLLLDTNDKNIYNSSNKSSYYLPQVNIWNHPHHNALPSSIEFKDEDTNSDYQKTENGVITGRRVEDGSTDISLGEYFEEQTNIKPLLPYEGDMVIEGRFGNSIRFGSTNIGESIPDENKNQWSQIGKTGDPITIIRNGQPEETDKKGWVPLIEDSNKDASIIYMTSNQQITEFTPASLNQQSFGANIESQTSWDQELSDPNPPTTVEPNPEPEIEDDDTAFGGGGPGGEPITSSPYTEPTGSQNDPQEEEEDELTPFDEFAGDQDDLYYYEIVLSSQNLGNERVEEVDLRGTYPPAGNLQIPLMNQADIRWGDLATSLPGGDPPYQEYSCRSFGCCLTSCAMAISHIVGEPVTPPMLMGGPNTSFGLATAAEAKATFIPRNLISPIDTTPMGSGVRAEWNRLVEYINFRTGNKYKWVHYGDSWDNGFETEEEMRDFLIAKLDAGIPVVWERKQDGMPDQSGTIEYGVAKTPYDTSTFIFGYNSPFESAPVQKKFVYGNQHWMIITGYTSDETRPNNPSFQVNDPVGASYRPDVSIDNLYNHLGRFMTFELKL